jgi:hypothetical protein
MPTKKGGSGLVFSSDSLKEFLGSSSKAGVSKKVVKELLYKKIRLYFLRPYEGNPSA